MRLTLLLVLAVGAGAQTLVPPGGIARAAQLLKPKAGEETLTCDLGPIPITLSYSLRYLAGYNQTMRLSEFPGAGHSWTTLLRVTPFLKDAVYLRRRVDVPEVPGGNNRADTAGGFFVGIGHYQVVAVVYDERGRVCRNDWEFDVKGGESKAERSVMPPNTVAEMSLLTLQRAPAAASVVDRLTLLVHAAPFDVRRIQVGARDAVSLTSSVAALLEKIPARTVRLVVFNLDQRKELFRRDNFQRGELDRVADAIHGVQLGLVDIHTLQDKTGDLNFLARLMNGELRAQDPSDLAIFLGPRARTDGSLAEGTLAKSDDGRPPFYFVDLMRAGRGRFGRGVFSPFPPGEGRVPAGASVRGARGGPASLDEFAPVSPGVDDAISRAVSKIKGKTYRVTTPAEFAKALAKILPQSKASQ
jgi:hypothetical protein